MREIWRLPKVVSVRVAVLLHTLKLNVLDLTNRHSRDKAYRSEGDIRPERLIPTAETQPPPWQRHRNMAEMDASVMGIIQENLK